MSRRQVLGFAAVTAAGLALPAAARSEQVVEADVCVYGATSAGVVAAVQARRLGRSVVLLEPGQHVGGMTASGLSETDSGRREAIGGIAREFYRRVREHYAGTYGPDSQQVRECLDGFRFEPSVAEAVFNRMLSEAKATVRFGERLKDVRTAGAEIRELVTEAGTAVRARVYLDCSYEGDLMAAAGVTYAVGREGNGKYGETLNGAQFGPSSHNFAVAVDPFVRPGDPASGRLPGISGEPPAPNGSGDKRTQAYNYRLCLTRAADRLPFPKPEEYDPARYILLARYIESGVWDAMRMAVPLPNGKADFNSNGAVSTDCLGGSWDYPEARWRSREAIIRDHQAYQQGLLWFLANDGRVPARVRDEVRQWGLPRDEFTATGGWPHQLYVREARRMVSSVVMTEHHCRGDDLAPDSVGLASYGIDSHHCQRVARLENGRWTARNEGDIQVPVPRPYPISYRAMVPSEAECSNLLVPVCLSASHVGFCSLRMEPVFMVLGQSAAVAAHLAMEMRTGVARVPYPLLRAQLLAQRQLLDWRPADPTDRADPPRLRGIVLDDRQAQRVGEWREASSPRQHRVGTGYLHDDNRNKGRCTLLFAPELREPGEYEIVLIGPPGPNRATNVPVEISIAGRDSVHATASLRAGDGLVSLGKHRLPAGRETRVSVSNKGTDGLVAVDGLQLLKS